MNIDAHMSDLAKKILRDETARQQLDAIVHKRSSQEGKTPTVEYDGKKYKVEFVDR